MRKVSIRELRNNLSSCLGDLPLTVTKNGKPIAKIVKSEANVYTNKKKEVFTKGKQTCNHGYPKDMCQKCKS